MEAARDDEVVSTLHLVKGGDLNHHQTLYAGRCVEWCVEAAYVTAESCFANPQPLVFISIRNLSMRSPARVGDLLRYEGRIDYVGESTIGVRVEVRTVQPKDERRAIASGTFLFCTVDEQGRAVEHGLPARSSSRPSATARWQEAAKSLKPGAIVEH